MKLNGMYPMSSAVPSPDVWRLGSFDDVHTPCKMQSPASPSLLYGVSVPEEMKRSRMCRKQKHRSFLVVRSSFFSFSFPSPRFLGSFASYIFDPFPVPIRRRFLFLFSYFLVDFHPPSSISSWRSLLVPFHFFVNPSPINLC